MELYRIGHEIHEENAPGCYYSSEMPCLVRDILPHTERWRGEKDAWKKGLAFI